MPYVTCVSCGLTTFSAAYRFNVDHCAGCGAELPRTRHPLVASSRPGSIELAVRERLYGPGHGAVERVDRSRHNGPNT